MKSRETFQIKSKNLLSLKTKQTLSLLNNKKVLFDTSCIDIWIVIKIEIVPRTWSLKRARRGDLHPPQSGWSSVIQCDLQQVEHSGGQSRNYMRFDRLQFKEIDGLLSQYLPTASFLA